LNDTFEISRNLYNYNAIKISSNNHYKNNHSDFSTMIDNNIEKINQENIQNNPARFQSLGMPAGFILDTSLIDNMF